MLHQAKSIRSLERSDPGFYHRSGVNWPPFRPDTRHSSEGLGISAANFERPANNELKKDGMLQESCGANPYIGRKLMQWLRVASGWCVSQSVRVLFVARRCAYPP